MHIVHTNILSSARFEALDAVLAKSRSYWDKIPCRLSGEYQSFVHASCLRGDKEDLFDCPGASSKLHCNVGTFIPAYTLSSYTRK
jgi:hypothetical protein